MSTCPHCRKHYREPDGEEGEHDCPLCGWTHADQERLDEDRMHAQDMRAEQHFDDEEGDDGMV